MGVMIAGEARPIIYGSTVPRRKGPTCIDLFAGAGGLAVGFRDAGFSVLAGSDVNTGAGATFRLNFPEAVFFEGQISIVTADALLDQCGLMPGELDCLIGGPPCQSFSYNNHQRSASDARSRLFEDYLRLVGELQPKMLVMENVPGILTIDDGSVVEEIGKRLRALGYDLTQAVLSAEEFGTPQVRKRVFIVASRVGSSTSLIPQPTHKTPLRGRRSTSTAKRRWISVNDAIGDLPPIENGGGLQVLRRDKPAFTAFQRRARRSTRTIYNHVCHALTETNLKRIVHVPEGGNWRDVPRDLLPAGMQRARLSDHTKRYGRLARKGLASTILTKCDPHWGAYVHPMQNRTISVREAARLQGFPDSFRFAGNEISKHYEQVGNAVPVPVARAVGAAAAAHLTTVGY